MTDVQEKYINLFTDFGFKKLFGETANIAKLQPEQRQAYEDSLKYYRDLKNVTDTAYDTGEQIGFEKGREEGEKSGLEKGREEGEKSGLEKGILLGKQEAALKMLAQGLDAEIVSKCVDLPVEMVQQLK